MKGLIRKKRSRVLKIVFPYYRDMNVIQMYIVTVNIRSVASNFMPV